MKHDIVFYCHDGSSDEAAVIMRGINMAQQISSLHTYSREVLLYNHPWEGDRV